MTEKLLLIKFIFEVIWGLLNDSDKDGRPDLFDSEPNNPEVK